MPAYNGPGFDHEDIFFDYCCAHGAEKSARSYRSHINMVAAQLNKRLGPETLRSAGNVQEILGRLPEEAFYPRKRSNCGSALRKYVAMIKSNFNGTFDSVAPAGIDVDEEKLPLRVRVEISRVVRDTAAARALKRLYNGQCQLCGNRLEVSHGEFYLEAHHLKPLGNPHNGPDVRSNLLCVCPNCHVLLDFNYQKLSTNNLKNSLHEIGQEFIEYHNAHCR